MSILALFKFEIPVEIVEVYGDLGGEKLVCVKALDGKPFVGGAKFALLTEWATVKASELSGVVRSDRDTEEVEAILGAYRKALEAAKEGKLDEKRVKRALVLALANERRPYETTVLSCSCPDAEKGNWCKHRIACLIWMRAEVNTPERAAEEQDLPLEPQRKNLLHMALAYQDPRQWNGDSVTLFERNGKSLAWLARNEGMIFLYARDVKGKVPVFMLTKHGWNVAPKVAERYHQWAEQAKAAMTA